MWRLETAVANSRRVLELEPDNFLAQCRLGMSLQNLDRLADAESSYRRALALKPDYPEAKTNLALLLKA
ncbi:MAG: tetratricopeptide repeat protein, partial [Betaproteobacteria bacterium]